jgi:hypothetical protein
MLLKAKVLAFWTLYEEQEGVVKVVECDSGDERSSLVGNVGEPDGENKGREHFHKGVDACALDVTKGEQNALSEERFLQRLGRS